MIDRVLEVVPPPHSDVQSVQCDQGVVLQSISHGSVLQLFAADKEGHFAPDPLGWVITVRVLRCIPPPHNSEH